MDVLGVGGSTYGRYGRYLFAFRDQNILYRKKVDVIERVRGQIIRYDLILTLPLNVCKFLSHMELFV